MFWLLHTTAALSNRCSLYLIQCCIVCCPLVGDCLHSTYANVVKLGYGLSISLRVLCLDLSIILVTEARWGSPTFNQERGQTRLWRQLWLVYHAPCTRSSKCPCTCHAHTVSSSFYPDAWPKKWRLHIGEGAQAWWIHFMNFGVVWMSQPSICNRYLLMVYVMGTRLQAHNVTIHHHLWLIWKNSNFQALISWHSSFKSEGGWWSRGSVVRAPATKAGGTGFDSRWLLAYSNADVMKDLWSSSIVWLLSTQMWMEGSSGTFYATSPHIYTSTE